MPIAHTFQQVLAAIKPATPVAVIGHLRPDGDCIGSQVALCRILQGLGKNAFIVCDSRIPSVLQPFVHDTPTKTHSDLAELTDCEAIYVDCSDAARAGLALAERFPKPLATIDHHLSGLPFAHHNIIVPTAAATAEVIASLVFELNLPLDAISAQALFVGLCTDTGQFLFPSTTATTFALASKLVQAGANPAQAGQQLFCSDEFPRIALLQRFLKSFRLEASGAICVGHLTSQDYAETEGLPEHIEGFVDFTRSLASVRIGACIDANTHTGMLKVSLRAKDPMERVDLIAAIFGGGGHACAAGFSIQDNLDTFYPILIDTLRTHLGTQPLSST